MSFPTATQARNQATDNLTVLSEIQTIETAVLVSVQAGELSNTEIGGNTTMTSTVAGAPLALAQAYFSVWKQTVANDAYAANMQSVIDYFSGLGYGIKRVTNTVTGNTFLWYVTW